MVNENKSMVAVVSALENKIVNISDVYIEKSYNFDGTKILTNLLVIDQNQC